MENKDGRPVLQSVEPFSISLQPLDRIHRHLSGARSQHYLPSLCFWGQSEKQDGCPDLWLAETFSTSPLKGIWCNFTGSKYIMASYNFACFVGDNQKEKITNLADSSSKVAYWTQLHDMWPFEPLVYITNLSIWKGLLLNQIQDTC